MQRREMSKFNVGDRVYVNSTRKGPGTVINPHSSEFTRVLMDDGYEDGYKDYKLTLIKENSMSTKQYELGEVINLKDTKVLTQLSDSEHPEFNNGELFVVVNVKQTGCEKLSTGQVIQLEHNDSSSYPYFVFDSTRNRNALYWRGLAKLPEGKMTKAQKPTVTNTRTVYSDGVEVSEESLTFDGKTFKREELKDLVKRYQEVLRRPVASVATVTRKTVKKGKK